MRKTLCFLTIMMVFPFTLQAACSAGDCRNGKGTFVGEDGRRYEGQFKEGFLWGEGKLILPDGSIYTEGPIRNRLTQERSDQRLSAYGLDGLFVTWATVNAIHRADVARYLANTLKPILGDRYPVGNQIKVNLPRFSHRTSSVSW